MAEWTSENGEINYRNGTSTDKVKCKTCKRVGTIKYSFLVETDKVTGHISERYTHLPTGTTGSFARNGFDRFLIETARAINDCGHRLEVLRIKGTHNPKRKCDARCINAIGPSCSCECGGENHSSGWSSWE